MDMDNYRTKLKKLCIGEKIADIPIIQGGMGVGISRSGLAGAVAKEGGVGVISTAQIGYDEEGFAQDQAGCNARGDQETFTAGEGNRRRERPGRRDIMVALKHYAEHVKESVAAGADVIISGAGLPVNLPALVSETCGTKIAPLFPPAARRS